jgi:hypothetical protein
LVIPDLQRIGKYDVLERIADGGFATLYRGRDPFLKRLVAIKVCASDDAELRQQFLREAEIAGNLDHPSIVRTFDFGFDPVGPYLVQEYLQGEDLSYLIAHRVALSTRRKLDLLVQIAEGLAYSHQRLVLHLDVKPGNVRVLGRRRAKILDFGIARLATGDAAPGAMLGTAGYVPPEQVMNKTVDARSDVFAFGALAYELLTYSRPFAGGTVSELLKRVLAAEAEPMTRHWRECDEGLADVIGRCLRRDPAGRYPSFELLLPDLVAIRDRCSDEVEVPIGVAADAAVVAARSRATEDDPGRTVEVAVSTHAEADRVESAALASWSAEPSSADTVPLGAAAPKVPKRRGGSRRTLMAGLAAAAALVTLAIVVFLPSHEPTAAAAPAAVDVIVPPRSSGPPPGLLVVTVAPWGRVSRLASADGAPIELPTERTTPLRLWLSPGRYRAELTLAGGGAATCDVEVASGGTQLCVATAVDEAVVPDGTDYFKEMGWWQ